MNRCRYKIKKVKGRWDRVERGGEDRYQFYLNNVSSEIRSLLEVVQLISTVLLFVKPAPLQIKLKKQKHINKNNKI
jgi:hypothetical protein